MVLLGSLCLLAATYGQGSELAGLREWGKESLDFVLKEYAIPGGDYMADTVRDGKRSDQPSFTWGVGVMLSALNAASETIPAYRESLRKFADASLTYWDTTPPVPGFNVLPNSNSGDRYYDDNDWMVLALFDTARILKDHKYEDWALKSLAYVLSGEDDKLGGGIYWKEKGKDSKNTCSNAPAIASCVEAYKVTHDKKYLEEATKLYAWTKDHLSDVDGLYFDNIRLNGQVEKTKWSYNSALMLRSAIGLYDLTKEPSYRDDVRKMVASSLDRWVTPSGSIHDPGRFAHLLLGAWMRSFPLLHGDSHLQGRVVESIVGALKFVYANCRRDEFYGDRWDGPVPADKNNLELIDQASVIRADFEAARFADKLPRAGGNDRD